jgi:hypothetical protein
VLTFLASSKGLNSVNRCTDTRLPHIYQVLGFPEPKDRQDPLVIYSSHIANGQVLSEIEVLECQVASLSSKRSLIRVTVASRGDRQARAIIEVK